MKKLKNQTKTVEPAPQIGTCPHCGCSLDFIPMPYLSMQQRVCDGCGEILQVDVAPMDFERIGRG